MNPGNQDLTPYLWNLNLINESSILHTLRNRYHNALPCTIITNTVMTCLTKNIIVDLENQRQVRLVPQPFTSSKLLPNLYSVANQCYRAMIINKRNQSIVFQGQSDGLTKRECIKEILKYLAETRTSKSDKLSANSAAAANGNAPPATPTTGNIAIPSFAERLSAMQSLVDFFCSAYESPQEKSTVMYNVEFDLGGRMIGINTQVSMHSLHSRVKNSKLFRTNSQFCFVSRYSVWTWSVCMMEFTLQSFKRYMTYLPVLWTPLGHTFH